MMPVCAVDFVMPPLCLNKAHYPVTTLGPGRRIGLWLQGCGLACPGCIAQDIWTFTADQALPLPVLLAWCQEVAQHGLDGITISGGEPFAQPEALLALLQALHDWRDNAGLNFDLLGYSGLSWRRCNATLRRSSLFWMPSFPNLSTRNNRRG